MDFWKHHQEELLLGLTAVFLIVLALLYIWGVGEVLNVVNQGIHPTTGQQTPTTFDLQDAQALKGKPGTTP